MMAASGLYWFKVVIKGYDKQKWNLRETSGALIDD